MLSMFVLAVVPALQLHARAAEALHDVEQVFESESIGKACSALRDRHDVSIDTMIELNEIPAPPFEEAARAERLAALFREIGIEQVQIDGEGNVLARRPGQSADSTVAIIAHLDTVFSEDIDVTVRRKGRVYSAPGIGDNARGLALMLDIGAALEAAKVKTDADILFVGSVGEEGLGDLRGVRALFAEQGDAIDSVVVIDGGNMQRLVTRAVGSNRYKVTFRGPGGHSYGSFGRAHPHQALAEAITRFTQAGSAIAASEGAKLTFSVGRIGGGTSVNSIPFESWMEVDMRSTDEQRLAEMDAALRVAVDEALAVENARARDDSRLTVDIQSVGRRPAGETPADTPLVLRAIDALQTIGVAAELSASSTDGNIPISLGIPTVTVSRGGRSRGAHSLDERWEDIDTDQAACAITLLVVAQAGLIDEGN